MATAGDSLKWQDLLEKEFDKAFVDLDVLLGDVDPDQSDITEDGRQHLTALSGSFAQLAQKAQTIFHYNAKLEAQLVALKADLSEATSAKQALEQECQSLLLQLHSAQLAQAATTAGSSALHPDATAGAHKSGEEIRKQLATDSERRRQQAQSVHLVAAERDLLTKENADLRHYCLALQSEVYGARLAAKYLDKELAGRIQQIQLLGRKMEGPEHDKLWAQLEAEIHLHRHKTVIRACRGRSLGKLTRPSGHDFNALRRQQGVGELRHVVIRRGPTEGLGMSVTGGKEHGVPVLISEIHPGLPAARTQRLYVGDAIVAVNGVSLRDVRHADAVRLLSQQAGPEVALDVVFVTPDDDSDEEAGEEGSFTDPSTGYRFRLYDERKSAPREQQQPGGAASSSVVTRFTNSNGNNVSSGAANSAESPDSGRPAAHKARSVNSGCDSGQDQQSDTVAPESSSVTQLNSGQSVS
ncbi:hypothetical protein BOX15_Mlig016913g3 [Macrostomum lignano]|uniref:PDZ domain-containing protein n=2 Tax=Macrostomum lignano TaxID=282301 RepID=A0A1I8GBA2_9PLAT|nr:hypothetical protein BOX15_Mlig016913g3 [Macrostomum lignano]